MSPLAIDEADRVAALLFAEHNPAFLERFYYDRGQADLLLSGQQSPVSMVTG